MTLDEIKKEFSALPMSYKTADLDRLNRRLIARRADVSCLAPIILDEQKYHRTYFQVSLALLPSVEARLDFIEANFDKLNDWWHVDQLTQFLGGTPSFGSALSRAQKYVKSPLPFARRWGYVLFMPTLVKEKGATARLIQLFHEDSEYYVIMAEAWLLSYLAVYEPKQTHDYLASKPFSYNIAGRAIQKICDSYRIDSATKERFKALRALYKEDKNEKGNI